MDDDATGITYKGGVERILDLLQSSLSGQNYTFYEGDPINFPAGALPAIVVEKVAGNVSVDATSTDMINEQITIKVVMDKRDDLGAPPDAILTDRKLRRIVEARDATTSYFAPDTLMFILRTNITLGGAVLDQDIDVNYDVNPRPDGVYTSEAQLTVVLRERVIVPNRV
jgi:hypothetical protein